MSVVLDASLVVALLVPDAHQDAVRVKLTRWVEAGEELNAPAVLPFEVANVLARQVYDGELTLEDVAEIWQDLAALGLVLHPFDLTRDGAEVAAVTTELRRRHATDSSYVCLARRLRTVLWTLDGPLARNAAQVGLPVQLAA